MQKVSLLWECNTVLYQERRKDALEESIVQILRIHGLLNSFAIAVLFQIMNRSFRSASTKMFYSQSFLQLLLQCLLLLCMLVSPSAKPDLTSHISFSQDNNCHWFTRPILRNFQPD